MRIAWTCVCIALLTTAAGAQIPNAQVVRVGFPTAMTAGSGAVVREGRWAPVVTELQLPGRGLFEGSLRIISEDLDGDLAEYVTGPIVLNPEAGIRRFWNYAIGFERRTSAANWIVDLVDAAGGVVARVPVPPTEVLSNDDQLVVDISERPVNKLRGLHLSAEQPPDASAATQRYLHKTVISFMPARDIPDRWIGLEAVNVLIWDLPNPAVLSEPQLAAIAEWVRRGGQLVIGIGESWPALQESALAPLLPVQSAGGTHSVKRLRFFSEKYVTGATAPSTADPRLEGFASAVAIAAVEPGRDSLVTFRDQAQPGNAVVNLITMRLVGAGRVIAFAGSLRELTALPIDAAFFREFLDLTPIEPAYSKKLLEHEQGTLGMGATRVGLLGAFARYINFEGERSLFVLGVFVFGLAYFLAATAGSWWWLKRQQLTGLSWTVFAAFAIAASALSLGAVSITSGVRQGVESIQIVDLLSGQRSGAGFAWAGYGSALRTAGTFTMGSVAPDATADPSAASGLGGPEQFLRAFALQGPTISTFATPARYVVDPATGGASDVLVRATLKQFEGAWAGPTDGTVLGQLTADRATGQLLDNSWIQNDLQSPLRGGYLLYLDPRSRGGSFEQLDRVGAPAQHWRGNDKWPAALHVVSVFVPPLNTGERTRPGFARAEYGDVELELARWESAKRDPDPTLVDRPDLTTLWRLQQYWSGSLSLLPIGTPKSGIDPAAAATLLASTASAYISTNSIDSLESVGQLITLEGLPSLDILHTLVRGQALFLTWSDAPGPIALQRDGRPVRARVGFTLYRVRLPLQLSGQPPARLRPPEKKEAGATG